MTTAKIHRPNLLVADLDRSLRIYRDILGFQVAYAGPASEGGLMQNLFNLDPDMPLRIAFLSAVDRRFELYDPPRTDVAFTDPDGHRVVLFRQHAVD